MKLKCVEKETAILAKSLGFNEPCEWYYVVEFASFTQAKNPQIKFDIIHRNIYEENFYRRKNAKSQPHIVIAPEQALLQTWLRETHDIDALPMIRYIGENNIKKVYITGSKIGDSPIYFEDYDKCLEQALKEGLQYLKNLKKYKLV